MKRDFEGNLTTCKVKVVEFQWVENGKKYNPEQASEFFSDKNVEIISTNLTTWINPEGLQGETFFVTYYDFDV